MSNHDHLPDVGHPPTLSAGTLDAMISHAVAQPQHSPTKPARSPLGPTFSNILAFRPRTNVSQRLALGSGGMALAASLALAVVLFHNSPATVGTGISNAIATSQSSGQPNGKPDNLKDVSDMITFDVLDAAV